MKTNRPAPCKLQQERYQIKDEMNIKAQHKRDMSSIHSFFWSLLAQMFSITVEFIACWKPSSASRLYGGIEPCLLLDPSPA